MLFFLWVQNAQSKSREESVAVSLLEQGTLFDFLTAQLFSVLLWSKRSRRVV